MNIELQVIHAFSMNSEGGNPAGVVFQADELSNQTKQAIATKAGFPETAFVSSSAVADYKLEFFTPTKQIPHCGHATIATFSFLKSKGLLPGDLSSKETIDGLRTIRFANGQAFMEQKAPVFDKVSIDLNSALQSLRITPDELLPGFDPMIVNTGNAFLVVPVRDENVLARIDYDRDAVSQISERNGLIGFYVYTRSSADFDATTRMFAPYYGIDEEAGTGMAAGPLVCYLYEVEQMYKTSFKIEQGRFMKPASKSLILVDLELQGRSIHRLFAGGSAYLSKTVLLEIS